MITSIDVGELIGIQLKIIGKDDYSFQYVDVTKCIENKKLRFKAPLGIRLDSNPMDGSPTLRM